MVTEKEFLKALEVVKQYKSQINKLVEDVAKSKKEIADVEILPLDTDIKDWLSFHKMNKNRINSRIINALTAMYEDGFIYLSSIDKKEFLKYNNVGYGTWEEFLTITGQR